MAFKGMIKEFNIRLLLVIEHNISIAFLMFALGIAVLALAALF